MPGPAIADASDPILAHAPLRVGAVTLVVRDLDRMAGFYRDVIGLTVLVQDPGSVTLGVGGTPLLVLRHEPQAPLSSPRDAGLFHTAFLLPGRGALGAWLRHMAEHRLSITGAADHLVSEAVYLDDPEHNGIEIYADRPSATWPHADGLIAMATKPLDLDALMASADAPWDGMPDRSCVGHVHLRTGDLPRSQAFYGDLLGFTVMARYPGALFWGMGGYHHQLATNVWDSRGAGERRDPGCGLGEVELLAADPAVIAAAAARLRDSDTPVVEHEGGVVARDPWRTAVRLALAPAAQPARLRRDETGR